MTTTEPQPHDQSDHVAISPKERLFDLIDRIAVNESRSETGKNGFVSLTDGAIQGTLFVEKTDVQKSFFSTPADLAHAVEFPSTMYRVSLREEGGRLVTSFTITDGDEDVLVTNTDDHGVPTETEITNRSEIDAYIKDFLVRSGLEATQLQDDDNPGDS